MTTPLPDPSIVSAGAQAGLAAPPVTPAAPGTAPAPTSVSSFDALLLGAATSSDIVVASMPAGTRGPSGALPLEILAGEAELADGITSTAPSVLTVAAFPAPDGAALDGIVSDGLLLAPGLAGVAGTPSLESPTGPPGLASPLLPTAIASDGAAGTSQLAETTALSRTLGLADEGSRALPTHPAAPFANVAEAAASPASAGAIELAATQDRTAAGAASFAAALGGAEVESIDAVRTSSPSGSGEELAGGSGSGRGDPSLGDRAAEVRGQLALHDDSRPLGARLGRLIATRLRNGDSRFVLQLQPPHLGELQVRMGLSSGALDLSISVESAAVRHLLYRRSGELQAALQRAGIELEQFEIEVVDDGATARQSFPWDGEGGETGSGPGEREGAPAGELVDGIEVVTGEAEPGGETPATEERGISLIDTRA